MDASNWRLRGCITFTDAQLHSLGPNEPWGVAASNLDFDNRAEYAVAGRPPAFLLSQLLILLLLLCRRVNTGRQLGWQAGRAQPPQELASGLRCSSLPAVNPGIGPLQTTLFFRLWTLVRGLETPEEKKRTQIQRTSGGDTKHTERILFGPKRADWGNIQPEKVSTSFGAKERLLRRPTGAIRGSPRFYRK